MASRTISPADRIRDLSNINAEVAAILQSAGQAINSLTDQPLSKGASNDGDTHMETGDGPGSLQDRKDAFTEHTQGYFTHIQAVVARLRRHAYALEEAGIITAEAPVVGLTEQQKQAAAAQAQQRAPVVAVAEPERITNGGLGTLDVGYLNSRGNKVATEKESELIGEVKKLLEESLAPTEHVDDAIET